MEWNQALVMSCAAFSSGGVAAGVLACGWFLRAASERALRADYRALLWACEKSVREGHPSQPRGTSISGTARGLEMLDARRKVQRENLSVRSETSAVCETHYIDVRALRAEAQRSARQDPPRAR